MPQDVRKFVIAVESSAGVEIGIAITWLGKRFERFDLSVELRP